MAIPDDVITRSGEHEHDRVEVSRCDVVERVGPDHLLGGETDHRERNAFGLQDQPGLVQHQHRRPQIPQHLGVGQHWLGERHPSLSTR